MRLACLLLPLASCIPPSAADLARTRAVNEFACPAESLSIRTLSHDTEYVEACGHRAVYTCPQIDRFDRVCIREPSPVDVAPPPEAASSTPVEADDDPLP